jgi:hypothetical protein
LRGCEARPYLGSFPLKPIQILKENPKTALLTTVRRLSSL